MICRLELLNGLGDGATDIAEVESAALLALKSPPILPTFNFATAIAVVNHGCTSFSGVDVNIRLLICQEDPQSFPFWHFVHDKLSV